MVNNLKRFIAFLLPSLFFALLIFSALTNHAHASIISNIDPTGAEIESPVTVTVTIEDWLTDIPDSEAGLGYWTVLVSSQGNGPYPDDVFGECLTDAQITDREHVFTLPEGYLIYEVALYAGDEDTVCEGTYGGSGWSSYVTLESGSPILSTIIAGESSSFGGMINLANVQFASTTGFDIPAVADWAGDNLIKLVIGSGLNIIYGLRYWIVALVIIGAILAFAYRAFRFFKH